MPKPTGASARIAAFISIPRNASNTIRVMLDAGPNRDLDTTDSLIIHENHQRGAVLRHRYDVSRLFVFCFVRNPYHRCVSWYKYHRNLEPYHRLSFEQWVEAGLPHHWAKQNQTDYAETALSPLLQMTFVQDCKVDFIGRIENFETDIKYLIKHLNRLCEENRMTPVFHYRAIALNATASWLRAEDLLSERAKAIIRSQLRHDFEYFGYESE